MKFGDLLRIPLYIVAPPVCQICGRRLESGLICDACQKELDALRLPVKCFMPMDERLKLICAPYRFDGVAADIVHLFKYNGNMEMGRFMARAMAGIAADAECDLLVPVPLFPARRRERGFSQTRLLARWISEFSELPFANLLRRNRYTPPQARIKDHSMRFENVKGAFELAVPNEQVRGKAVLLVDDVTTTGATLSEAAAPLIAAGADSVCALVFAVAG